MNNIFSLVTIFYVLGFAMLKGNKHELTLTCKERLGNRLVSLLKININIALSVLFSIIRHDILCTYVHFISLHLLC